MNDSVTPNDIAPGQPWVVDIFRPQDAAGVINLFLSVYGPDYPIKKFIQPELLIQENASRSTVSTVARTPKGDIVGHNAVFHSAPYEGLFESGSGAVHRHYRGGQGIFTQMYKHGIDYAVRELGAQAMFGEPVLNHVISQKMTHKEGFVPMAVEVDLMPASAYVKEKSAEGRVSTILDFKTFIRRPHTVFLPARYQEQLSFLYQGLDDQRDFQPSLETVPAEARTDIRVQHFEFAQVARVAVPEVGLDYLAVLENKERRLVADGVVMMELWLKLTWPWIAECVEGLRRQGYYFGGLLPRWFNDDGLLMQKQMGTPNWDNMVILLDRSREIVRLAKADWAEVSA